MQYLLKGASYSFIKDIPTNFILRDLKFGIFNVNGFICAFQN